MSGSSFVEVAKLASELQLIVDKTIKPPSETAPSAAEPVVYMAMIRSTRRGYLERLSHQINGSYASGWYDACAVMIRRLVETLIIEVYETHGINAQIKDAAGNYWMLRDLVDAVLAEPTWTLGRATRKALPLIKDLGDKSAHNRRFTAHREDVDKVLDGLRTTVQEFIYLAKLS